VIEFARKDFLHEGWIEASSLLFVPFSDGVLELATLQLLEHSPDYGFTWQLPRPYSTSDKEWPMIDTFLDVLCVKNQQLKNVALAYCNAILKGRADLQKFMYLFGSGANGKGSFMSLLAMLIGQENTHTTTMKELNDSRFESANLRGKRLVLMTDEDRRAGGFGIFKAATGQDPIRYERKGKDANNFVFKGMFVVAANAPTFVGESSPALKRRKIDFPCSARIPEADRRDITPDFDTDLPAFTSHLLTLPDSWVTDTLRGASKIEAVKDLGWEMAVREDSIAGFYDDRLMIDPNGITACGEVYKAYKEHCEESGLRAKSLNNFTPALLDLCNITLSHSVIKKRYSGGYRLEGIRFKKDEDFILADTAKLTVRLDI
jgi:putative DNA primase/helicase